MGWLGHGRMARRHPGVWRSATLDHPVVAFLPQLVVHTHGSAALGGEEDVSFGAVALEFDFADLDVHAAEGQLAAALGEMRINRGLHRFLGFEL